MAQSLSQWREHGSPVENRSCDSGFPFAVIEAFRMRGPAIQVNVSVSEVK